LITAWDKGQGWVRKPRAQGEGRRAKSERRRAKSSLVIIL
jgi:hypothetical protein